LWSIQVANRARIVPIVEGPGEEKAVPALLHKLLVEMKIYDIGVAPSRTPTAAAIWTRWVDSKHSSSMPGRKRTVAPSLCWSTPMTTAHCNWPSLTRGESSQSASSSPWLWYARSADMKPGSSLVLRLSRSEASATGSAPKTELQRQPTPSPSPIRKLGSRSGCRPAGPTRKRWTRS
jgi:hypothetical protein